MLDDSDRTIRRVGEYGLKPLTGIEPDDGHDGPWWRQWWEKNKQRYPSDVRGMKVPKLSRKPGPHGAAARRSSARKLRQRNRGDHRRSPQARAEYENLDVLWRTVDWTASPMQVPGGPIHEISLDCRSVCQNGMVYMKLTGEAPDSPHVDKTVGFDGTVTRVYNRKGIAEIIERRDERPYPLRPYTALFRYAWELIGYQAPFASVLEGADLEGAEAVLPSRPISGRGRGGRLEVPQDRPELLLQGGSGRKKQSRNAPPRLDRSSTELPSAEGGMVLVAGWDRASFRPSRHPRPGSADAPDRAGALVSFRVGNGRLQGVEGRERGSALIREKRIPRGTRIAQPQIRCRPLPRYRDPQGYSHRSD